MPSVAALPKTCSSPIGCKSGQSYGLTVQGCSQRLFNSPDTIKTCVPSALQCLESGYINSRPFRINAGPVHAYAQAPGGRTAYLSELRSGASVLIADASGLTRTGVVGRVKIEARPLVLVEAQVIERSWAATVL